MDILQIPLFVWQLTDGPISITIQLSLTWSPHQPQVCFLSLFLLVNKDTANWIASDIQRVMDGYPTTIFAGAVTDNTSTNKNAWEQLSKLYPSAFFQGCTSHGLHLLVKDIFAATKTRKAGDGGAPSYPIDYPFENLLEFIVACKDIVKLFHNNHILKAKLEAEQLAHTLRHLVRPAPTRWGTIKGCCEWTVWPSDDYRRFWQSWFECTLSGKVTDKTPTPLTPHDPASFGSCLQLMNPLRSCLLNGYSRGTSQSMWRPDNVMLSIVGACLRGGRFSDDKIGSLLNGPFDSSTTASSAHKHYRLSRCYASCANHVKETHTLRTRFCLESIIPVWGLSWWHQHRATRITGELWIRVWSTLLYHSMHRVVVKHEIHHTHVQQVRVLWCRPIPFDFTMGFKLFKLPSVVALLVQVVLQEGDKLWHDVIHVQVQHINDQSKFTTRRTTTNDNIQQQ